MQYFRFLLLILGVAIHGAASVHAEEPQLSGGTLTLRAGDYVATFLENASWTLDTLDFKGVPLITATGANQTVVKLRPQPGVPEKEEWIGTKHGQEIVESIALEIDGKSHALTPGEKLPEGARYVIRKVSRFGPLRGKWTVQLDATGLRETASFEKIDEDISAIVYSYVFMHCWSPRMMDWLAVLKDGAQVGERFPDTASKSLQKDISSLAVYSDSEQTGALLTYPKAYEGFPGRQSFLNNFPGRHNKIYLTVSREALVREPYSCWVQGFTADPQSWEQTVVDLIARSVKTE